MFMQKLIKYVDRSAEKARSFEEVREKFISEFERETQELGDKWREYEGKKAEFKRKLNEEKETL